MTLYEMQSCPACGGGGVAYDETDTPRPCPACGGQGWTIEEANCPETGTPCLCGCQSIAACYIAQCNRLAADIRRAGEVGPHAATAVYALGMTALGPDAARESRVLIAC
ncbi:MAG: hypothetical protein ACTHMU_00035, partial [Thermomicrobiales bacterium]